MARMARIVVPNIPYHVTQRGNRRQAVFFSDEDRQIYLRILQEQSRDRGLEVWAYCLMDNHVHLIVVPREQSSLAGGIGETHRRYTRYINEREGWTGYLWQGRFGSFPMDQSHLFTAIRYVERNPVEAGLVQRGEDYPWSSARAHVFGTEDPILTRGFVQGQIRDWRGFLEFRQGMAGDPLDFDEHSRTGRPLGEPDFIGKLERQTGRVLHKRKPGRKAVRSSEIGIVSPE